MFMIDQTVLLVIDVQGKLARLVHEKEILLKNLQAMIKGARILQIPILWTEQIPSKIGSTIPVKFSLGGDRGLAVFAAGYPKSEPIAGDSTAPVNGIEQTVTASVCLHSSVRCFASAQGQSGARV